MSVTVIIQNAKRMRHIILPSVSCPIVSYFPTISHKRHDFRVVGVSGVVTEHEVPVLIFSLQLLSETYLTRIVLYCGRVSTANAPRMHCSRRLILQTLVFSRSYVHRQVSPPETLVVKGGTTWERNGR